MLRFLETESTTATTAAAKDKYDPDDRTASVIAARTIRESKTAIATTAAAK